MEYNKKEIKTFDVKFIGVKFPLYYESEREVYGEVLKDFIKDDFVEFMIDVDNGKIVNGPGKLEESVELFLNVVDEGIYTLYDENKRVIEVFDGHYVPNSILPEYDGFGDYVSLSINEDCLITNWYKTPTLEDFE